MKFHIRTFGCQMNKHDSDRLAAALSSWRHEFVEDAQEAELVVFNTCCVRQHAEERLYGNVDALRPAKASGQVKVLAVTGCVAQKEAGDLLSRLPHVDIVTGTFAWPSLPALVDRVMAGESPIVQVGDDLNGNQVGYAPDMQDKRRAWVSVMTGCDNHCSYCIVPAVRGRERSRRIEDVLAEVKSLVRDGVQEVTLLGQNVNSFGRDIYGKARFADLLSETRSIKGLRRVRFTTSHPRDFSSDIVDVLAEGGPICPHVHLPVQSGSDRVLREMGRHYTRNEYVEKVAYLRERVPRVSVTTDIMVGFPSETEEDFEATLDLVQNDFFDQAFLFVYSPRQGTEAAGRSDQVPEAIKKERFSRLLRAQHAAGLRRNERDLHKPHEVYVEAVGPKGKHSLKGRTAHNKLIHFDGPSCMVGSYAEVLATEAHSWYLVGRLK